MASEAWIESADRAGKRAKKRVGQGFLDRGEAVLAGASETARHARGDEVAAGRMLAEHAPDCATALDVTVLPAADAATPLVRLVAAGDWAGAREWIDGRTLTEISAVRTALAERRRP